MLRAPAKRKGRFGALFCFLALVSLLAIVPSHAQRVPVVGVTLAGSPPDRFAEAFRLGMADLGWRDGKNVRIEYRYAGGRPERFRDFIDEFVRTRVDVIVAGGGNQAQLVAQKATQTIPIVFPINADPLNAGLVSSLARPRGNMTGLSMLDTSAKRLELLKEAFPRIGRIAALDDPSTVVSQRAATAQAAKTFGLEVQFFSARRLEELEPAIRNASRSGADAILVLTSGFFNANARRIVELVNETKMIAVYDNRTYADAGGLMSYGTDLAALYRLSARYVDKILKGAKPGDLPVEQPTTFELVINRSAATRLGVAFPPTIAMRADHVIEK